MRLGPRTTLVEDSPLRRTDPRAKLFLSLCASLAVMLSLECIIAFMAIYALCLLWARLLPAAARQVWRIRWLLVGLFAVDWLVVSLDLAVIVTMRVALLSGILTLVVCTTTPTELRLALERLRVPSRYAFSLSLAFQSIGLLEQEWYAIQEAQRARGAWSIRQAGWRRSLTHIGNMVALTVPAIVLTTKRAWGMTEAAYARGFGAPHRRSFRQLHMSALDWGLVSGAIALIVVFSLWHWRLS